jgi:type IV pilus assembly protein PilA
MNLKMTKKQEGFSFIELLTVVAIILIIAAIATPNLLRSKIAANQASAVGSLHALNISCVAYSVSYGQFPAALSNLGPISSGGTANSTAADLIDSMLAAGSKSGYTFAYAPGNGNQSYTITAIPITASITGEEMYFTDQSGVIRVNASGLSGVVTSTPGGTSGSGAAVTSTPIG